MQSLSKQHGIFHKARTNNLKICMETQRKLSNPNNLDKEQSWRNCAPWLQTTRQSYSN